MPRTGKKSAIMDQNSPPPTDTSPPNPRVLVIDDEPGLRDMLRFNLPKRGFIVECAADGEEALLQIRKAPFDVVICDIMMPGMSGVDVLQHIKELAPETQVIMATGFGTLETAVESMKRGAFDYVTKPYTLPQLCTLLEKAMDWQRLRARVNHLEELDRLKDEFIATISHELRTPITVIMGYSVSLREGRYSQEEQRNSLQVIESKAKGLLQMINNILDLASASSKREFLVMESCSAGDLAREIYEALKPVAEAKKLELHLETQPELQFETDRTKCKQILLHLLDNAIKFTATGRISIDVEPADDHHVSFRIQDTGIGIEEHDIPLIFEKFRQVDQSRTRSYNGAGLGLAVCNRFVNLLGGTIAVESRRGQGATFTVVLPGRIRDSVAPRKSDEIKGPHINASAGPRLLLVADDDPSMTRLFQSLLTREGYMVNTAGGGKEALDEMARQKPDAILLDLMMPEVSGFQVLEAMDKDPVLKGVKVFIMTAKDLLPDELAKLTPRAELILQKGAKDLPEILALLNKHMRRIPRS